MGYRFSQGVVDNSPALAFLPAELSRHLVTGFIQDEIKLIANRLHLTIGSKIEHNEYTGFECQPSGRIAWTPAKRHMFWGAISRAVRTPSRIDRHLFAPRDPPFLLAGNRAFKSEKLYAFELGYKAQPASRLTASISTFYNIYEELRSLEVGPPAFLSNELEGESYGAEFEAAYQPTDWWRIAAGYAWFDLQLRPVSGSTDTSGERQEGDSPQHQFFVRSSMDLFQNVELDATVRYVDELPNQRVPEYMALSIRIGWRPCKNLELSVVGANLLDPQHPEFGSSAARKEIERSVYGKIRWEF